VLKRPTVHDVAAQAGVSIKTVSRVVNAEANVSPELRDRVLAAVKDLQYVQNSVARSLKVGLGDTVGVVIDSIADPFFAALTSAAEATALEAGLNVVFGSTGHDAGRERRQVERMAMQQVRGLILAPVQGDHSYLTHYRHSLPVVLVDRALETDNFDTVLVDDYNATREAVKHLLRHGHRHIAFIGADPRFVTVTERLRGYHDAMDRAGVPRDRGLVAPGISEDGAGAATLLLLRERPDVTALFAANTTACLGAVHILHSARRTDVAMVGFGDFPLAGMLEPGITCVDQDPRRIGEVATEQLLARLGLGPVEPSRQPTTEPATVQPGERVVLPTRLVQRGSGEIVAAR
jgi:LacI family transcriptional regulator